MADLRGVAAGSGRGSRAVALFLGILPLTGLLAACGSGGGSGGGEGDLIVLAVTPTNGQETLSDLSDPGVGGSLTIKFTAAPKGSTMIDDTNSFNGLTPYVQVLDQSFSRVPGTPNLDKSAKAFTFTPAGGTLPPAQYTVTVAKFVTTASGRQLNNGIEDFSASWTVGPDVYSPVVRNISPAQNQKDTPLFTPIVVTFNESLDPATVVLGQTVFVQDGGTNPPTQLNGTLSLQREGFDLVFAPDACVGLPPSTTVVVRILGAGNTSFLKDRVGNALVGNPANSNELQYQFNTKGVKPLPITSRTPPPWSPKINPRILFDTVAYITTGKATYAFDVADATVGYLTNQVLDLTRVVQVLQGNFPLWQYSAPNFIPITGAYGGDWEAKLGIPGEAVLDWRYDGTTGHTYIYQIDEATDSVAIINSANGKIEGHFNGVGTPKGITISGPGATGVTPTLFISNYGQGTVTGIPLGLIQAGQPICTAVKELNDDLSRRVYLQAGKNPAGMGAEQTLGVPIAGVVNQGDNEFQVFDPQTLKPIENLGLGTLTQRYQVGESPIDVGFTPYLPLNQWIFAYVVNQGGPNEPDGSVSLWWNQTGLVFTSGSGTIIGTIQEGLNVPGKSECDPLALSCWLGNSGSDDAVRLDVTILGSGLGSTIATKVGLSRVIGPNPTKVVWTGLPGLDICLATLSGSGQVAVWERVSTVGPPVLFNLPGVKGGFTAWSQ